MLEIEQKLANSLPSSVKNAVGKLSEEQQSVFEEDYKLPTLNQVESFIKVNKHLPDIPSAKEVKENGIGVSEMMAKQIQKIEELTLYVIAQNKKIEGLEKKLAELEERK